MPVKRKPKKRAGARKGVRKRGGRSELHPLSMPTSTPLDQGSPLQRKILESDLSYTNGTMGSLNIQNTPYAAASLIAQIQEVLKRNQG